MTLAQWIPRKDVGIKILETVKAQGLGKDAGVIAIMSAMAESSIRILDYGDTPTSTSRGLYQQQAPWGPYADRMDAVKSTLMFLNGGQAAGTYGLQHYAWRTMDPWVAVQRVQGSQFGDGSNYRYYYDDAVSFVDAYWPQVNDWNLPPGYYYGLLTGPNESISGLWRTDTDAHRAAIKRIQTVLGLTADGHYGDSTFAAVKKWQTAHKLPATGNTDQATWKSMGL